MIDYIILAVIALILGLAIFYIIRSKKRGAKCVGCPYSKSCNKCDNKKTPCDGCK